MRVVPESPLKTPERHHGDNASAMLQTIGCLLIIATPVAAYGMFSAFGADVLVFGCLVGLPTVGILLLLASFAASFIPRFQVAKPPKTQLIVNAALLLLMALTFLGMCGFLLISDALRSSGAVPDFFASTTAIVLALCVTAISVITQIRNARTTSKIEGTI